MIWIMLPAFNEEHALRPLLEKIEQIMADHDRAFRVVVVDDGSTDDTAGILAELAQQYPLDVVTHRFNRGLGETARDGFEYVAQHGAPDDVVVRMDCDDTHEPKYIPELVAMLDRGYEVAICSRYAPGGGEMGLDWYRRTISRVANTLFKLAFPIRGVWEYTCGYRAYRVAVIQDALAIFGNKFIDLKGLGFTGTLEKLIKFRMMGARIVEIPFVLRYDQKYSQSKVVTSITTLGCFVLIIKHFRYWNEEGRRWKAMIEERKARVYGGAPPPKSRPGSPPALREAPATTDLTAVREFWNANPLFKGESRNLPGSRAFFEEHEQLTDYEIGRSLLPFALEGSGPGRVVADVGCGIGYWVEKLARTGATVHACDLSETAVDLTRKRIALFDLDAEVGPGNAEALPYDDGTFDHVNCQGVIHHTPDTEACIDEFRRVLKPDGTVCFSVYYRMWLLRSRLTFRVISRLTRGLIQLKGRGREGMMRVEDPDEFVRLYDGADNPIGRAYTRQALRDMLDGKFEIMAIKQFGVPRRVMKVPMPALIQRLLEPWFGLMIVLRCRRLPDPVASRMEDAAMAQVGESA